MKRLKLFFACLLMAVLSIGQVWATSPATITFSELGLTNQQQYTDPFAIDDNVTITFGGGANDGKYYDTGAGIRTYGGGTITINAGSYTITEAAFTWDGSNKPGADNAAPTGYSTSTGKWTGSASSIVLTRPSGSGHWRLKSVTVTYSTGGSTKTLTGVTVSGTPTTTSYENGNAFNPAGLVVTGTYDIGDPAAITSGITWTACKTEGGTYVALDDEAVALAKDETGIYVKATVSEITSPAFHVTGLTVTAAQPKITIDGSATGITTTDEAQTITAGVGSFGGTFKQLNTTALWFTSGTGYIYNTESFGYIRKITINYKSGGSPSAYQWIKMGSSAMNSYEAASTNGVKYETSTGGSSNTFVVDGDYEYFCLSVSNKNLQASSIVIEYDNNASAPKAATPTFPTGDENFVTSTSVTLACTTEGAKIYYTTNGDVPTSSSTLYNGAIPVSATTTIKAIAVADGMDNSNVAEKTFTKVTPKTTAAELRSFATSSAQNAYIQLDGWKVTFVSGNNAYIIDPSNEGVILNNAGHGYVAGDELNDEVVEASVKLASGRVQLSGFTSANITATSGTATAAEITDFSTITSVNQSRLVTLKDATYASADGTFSDGTNVIYYYDQFSASPTLVDGTTYDVTGIVIYYDNGTIQKLQIAPRTSADVEAQSPVVIPTAANLAALKAADRGTYILTLDHAVVSYVNGKNAFIEDATAGALIFIQDHGYNAGDCLTGDYQVTTTDYQGKFEITAIEAQAGAATTTASVPLTTVSIATLNANFASYESRRIKIEGANVTDAISGSDRNGAISDGAALAVYAGVASTITLTLNDNVDIIGYPGFHNTDEQLTVWAQADITVNEKEDPEISYSPATLTIEEGDDWSAPTFNNPHSLAIASYVSDNEAVATVTDGGVIALAGGIGTAVITAHTNGNATYAAGNATYTITVNEAGSYSMSFDFTRASYDDAADEAVVWNSSVATITATKGTGTKVTNYLAGNYSGTTLIAETRLYANNSLGFEAKTGASITKVEVTMTAASYASALAGYDWTNASAEVSSTNNKVVVITPTAATFSAALGSQIRIAQVAVYYTAESEKSKLTASIAIDDMNMAVGDDDILLSAIAATSNPNKKAISYAVTSGSEYVSITGEGAEAALHAIAEGTATVTATIPNDLGNYTGATTTFDVVVAAAPATLVSIAISGEATNLEYTAGQTFNPAGLVVTGHYSDNTDAEITTGIDWAFDPATLPENQTSVSVTATVGEISSDAVVVNGLTVAAAPTPISKKVVIIAEFESKLYAMSNTVASKACAAIEVEKDGSNLVVSSTEDKAAVQWLMTTSGDDVTLQDADDKYLSASSGDLSVAAAVANWSLTQDGGYYLISMASGRALMYRNTNVFKHYSTGNTDGYAKVSEIFEVAEGATNIVISSKVDPELAYTPASDEITVGDAWSAPSLGYVEGFDGLALITYESSNEAVATVTDAGVIALAGGTGTATITATFGGNATYGAGNATYTITVNAPAPTPTGTTYTKVTSTAGITDGEYLIVYEGDATHDAFAFNGSLENVDQAKVGVAVTINEGVIAGTTAIDAATFTIDVTAGTLQSASGYYIGRETYDNGMDKSTETAYTNTFAITDGEAVITGVGGCTLRYNYASDQLRFRYYKSGQQAIQLYKKDTPTPDYTRGVTVGNYGTICLPNGGNISGAKLFDLEYYDGGASTLYLLEVEGNAMVAGKPYIFLPSVATIEVFYTDDANAPAGSNNGLIGWLGNENKLIAPDAGNYILYQSQYWFVNSEAYVTPNHAYIHMDDVPTEPLTPAPGAAPRRRVSMAVNGENAATGFENIESGDAPMKVMIEGTMYILRGEKVYDATGRLVK